MLCITGVIIFPILHSAPHTTTQDVNNAVDTIIRKYNANDVAKNLDSFISKELSQNLLSSAYKATQLDESTLTTNMQKLKEAYNKKHPLFAQY